MTVSSSGPCSWPDVGDQLCCPDWDDYSPAVKEQASTYAKMILWAATGRQFGLCELTVRPCGRQCENCDWNGWYYDGAGSWVPYIWNGVWKNCWCGNSPGNCSCAPECQVYLPGPVYTVTSVRIGGQSLAVSGSNMDVFVLDQQWLVRVDTTECWPLCGDNNNLNLPPGDPNIFEVTYLRGKPVPDALANAYATLACEYGKACLGLACRLPNRITSISRQGVTISMVDIAELLRAGLTGLWEVDQVIRALNPKGITGRARFYSPDLQEPRQVTSP